MTTVESFDKKTATFKKYQDAPWTRLRYQIALANLKRHIDNRTFHLLDAGGGLGLEAISFAEQGCQVAFLDYSAEMLVEARQNAETKGVGKQIEFYQAEIASIPTLFPEPQFDLILCHNVLEYVDNLDTTLKAVCHSLKPNGLVSIICANRYSEVYRFALQERDLKAAHTHLDTREIISKVFDTSRKVYAAEEIILSLQKVGCSVIGQYGIRCINDYISPNDELRNEPAFFVDMEKLEFAVSDKFPYYLLGRFFHLVAKKMAHSGREAG